MGPLPNMIGFAVHVACRLVSKKTYYLGFSSNKYKRATDRCNVVVHVYATCLSFKRHGASGFTLLKNPPSILTFTWCYGAVKHLFVRRFLVPGGAGRHAQFRARHTSQEADTEQCADDKRLEEKCKGEGDE